MRGEAEFFEKWEPPAIRASFRPRAAPEAKDHRIGFGAGAIFKNELEWPTALEIHEAVIRLKNHPHFAQTRHPPPKQACGLEVLQINPSAFCREGFKSQPQSPFAQVAAIKNLKNPTPEIRIFSRISIGENLLWFCIGEIQSALPRDEKLPPDRSLGVENNDLHPRRHTDLRRPQTSGPATDDRDALRFEYHLAGTQRFKA
jgi:hypothetical protein